MITEPGIGVPHLRVAHVCGEAQVVLDVIGEAGQGGVALLRRHQRADVVVGRTFAADARGADNLAIVKVAQRTIRVEGLALEHARHDQAAIGCVREADIRHIDEVTRAVAGRNLRPTTDIGTRGARDDAFVVQVFATDHDVTATIQNAAAIGPFKADLLSVVIGRDAVLGAQLAAFELAVQRDVDHTGYGARTPGCRGAARDNISALDQHGRDRVQVVLA
ncbi:hypothetical protein D3C72_725420 [compost metagenome]